MTHHTPEFLRQRFPSIHAECLRWGIDMTEKPIPVGARGPVYICGVVTDTVGRALARLYAIGEVACIGGSTAPTASRATRSLLEGPVFGRRCADFSPARSRNEPHPTVPDWDGARPRRDEAVIAHNWDEIRRPMWNFRRHRPARPAASSAPHGASRRFRKRSASTTGSTGHAGHARAAQHRHRRRAHRRVRSLPLRRAAAPTADHPRPTRPSARDTVIKRGFPAQLRQK